MEENKPTSEKIKVSMSEKFRRVFSTRKKKNTKVDTSTTPTYPKDRGDDFEQTVIVNSVPVTVATPTYPKDKGNDFEQTVIVNSVSVTGATPTYQKDKGDDFEQTVLVNSVSVTAATSTYPKDKGDNFEQTVTVNSVPVTDANPTYPKDRGDDFEPTVIVNSANAITSKPSKPSKTESSQDEDDLYYKISDGREKIAIIFSHEKFKPRLGGPTPTRRHGTDVDCKRIKGCLEDKLGFKNTKVYQDFDRKRIMSVIKEVSEMNSSEVSCIVIVIMTHGNVCGILEAFDCMYPKSMLFDPFTKETSKLGGVPKLFFIQACRGTAMDGGVELDGEDKKDVSERMPRYADLLMMYSTVENFVSWREQDGTWMIQELCKQLDRVPCKWNVLDLMTFVSGNVARGYGTNNYVANDAKSMLSHGKLQMPQLESTLTKLLNFSR